MLLSTAICCMPDQFILSNDGKILPTGKRILVATSFDALISITALVIGILHIKGTLHFVSPSASYALVGVSGIITLAWIFMAILSKGEVFKDVKNLVVKGLCYSPSKVQMDDHDGEYVDDDDSENDLE